VKTKIINTDDNWVRIKNACRITVNKEHTDNEPTNRFKTKLLISEHSPIRLLRINWLWEGIKSWISVHFARHHVGIEKFISTQRTDRTGINRDELPQGSLVNFEGEANAQSLIDITRKRLCYQSSKETREYMEDFKIILNVYEPELSDVLVPNCIYRCGCPEFEECGYWSNFIKKHKECDLLNIENRYKCYNRDFYTKHCREDEDEEA
jgi:hypothetical protein